MRNDCLITILKMQPPELFYKKPVLKMFTIIKGKHLKFLKTSILNEVCKRLPPPTFQKISEPHTFTHTTFKIKFSLSELKL